MSDNVQNLKFIILRFDDSHESLLRYAVKKQIAQMVSFFERFTCSEILQKFLVHDTEYLRNTVTFDSTYVLCGYVYIFHIELFRNSIAVNLLELFLSR